MQGKTTNEWLTTMETASRYLVSTDTLRLWRRFEGFPKSAVVRESHECSWNVRQIDSWLRSRPVHKNGRPPRWTGIVGHPSISAI